MTGKTNGQYKSLTAAKAAIKKWGLSTVPHDIMHCAASGSLYPNGYYFPVFYRDGYDEAEQDRSFIASLGFRCQKFQSSPDNLGYKTTVFSEHHNGENVKRVITAL